MNDIKINSPNVFIHCPKTGGTTVHNYPCWHHLAHVVISDDGNPGNPLYFDKPHQQWYQHNAVRPWQLIADKKVFFIVRNPLAWLLSWFDWQGGFDPLWKPGAMDIEVAKKGFVPFIENIMNRDTPWPGRRFIFCQAFSVPNGHLIVDHILHTECLDQEIEQLFGIKPRDQRKQVGKRKKKPIYAYYEDYPKLVDAIYECWEREFKLYGYGSDPTQIEANPDIALLYGNVNTAQKQKIKYTWNTDQLLY